MMTIGSLFSGIGGLELGLERAGLGPTLWQCEIDQTCGDILQCHWPGVRRYFDVQAIDPARLAPVDVLCGGFPCQDLSSAGRRVGLGGARSGLWSQFRRIVAGLRPPWIVIENVASGAVNWVDAVRGDLEQLGYESLPLTLAASDVGAWHRRSRVFVVAHSDGSESDDAAPKRSKARPRFAPVSADAHRAALWEQQGRRGWPYWRKARESSRAVTNAHPRPEHDQPVNAEETGQRASGEVSWPEWNPWTAEPDLARMVHGLPGRVDRERILGNAVVPQCAEVIGRVIRILSGDVEC